MRDMGARLAEETAEVMADLESGALTPRGGGAVRTAVEFKFSSIQMLKVPPGDLRQPF
jgi:hypothetical protein